MTNDQINALFNQQVPTGDARDSFLQYVETGAVGDDRTPYALDGTDRLTYALRRAARG